MNTIDKPDGKEEAAVMSSDPRAGEDTAGSGCAGGACSSSGCTLYRWYPPLLVVSTLMAGIFCALYLTKPVRLVNPANPPVPEGSEASAPDPASDPSAPVGDPGYGEMAEAGHAHLDPMLGGLPGLVRQEEGLQLATSGPGVMGGTGEGLEPLRVGGPREGLFVPGRPVDRIVPSGPDPEAADVVAAEAAMPEEIVDSGHGRLEPELPVTKPSAFVTEMALEVDRLRQQFPLMTQAESGSEEGIEAALGLQPPRGQAEEDVETHQPPASIIGEFYRERTRQGGPSPGERPGARI